MTTLYLPGTSTLAGLTSRPPTHQLSFYPFGVMLKKWDDKGGITEYAIDPNQLATLIAPKIKVQVATGLLTGSTLYVATDGNKRLVVDYRPPQKTGIFLDGAAAAARIPLPGLLMFRTTTGNSDPQYRIYAVKSRPADMKTPLFNAPLPNINSVGVCWGSVPRPKDVSTCDLTEDWTMLLGSFFGNHSTGDKSKAFKHDIRKKYEDMELKKTRTYPTRDLISAKRTLEQTIGELFNVRQ